MKSKRNISRRNFFKTMSATGLAITGLTACHDKVGTDSSFETRPGNMTYRTHPHNGDHVSLLGYGCMRWPMMQNPNGEVIDRETVNRLVDYALVHGVNYFICTTNKN